MLAIDLGEVSRERSLVRREEIAVRWHRHALEVFREIAFARRQRDLVHLGRTGEAAECAVLVGPARVGEDDQPDADLVPPSPP